MRASRIKRKPVRRIDMLRHSVPWYFLRHSAENTAKENGSGTSRAN
jgi:hypothetical protein